MLASTISTSSKAAASRRRAHRDGHVYQLTDHGRSLDAQLAAFDHRVEANWERVEAALATGTGGPEGPDHHHRGRGSVALDPATVAALQDHRECQSKENATLGKGYTDHGLVFTKLDGKDDNRPRRPIGTSAHPRKVAVSNGS